MMRANSGRRGAGPSNGSSPDASSGTWLGGWSAHSPVGCPLEDRERHHARSSAGSSTSRPRASRMILPELCLCRWYLAGHATRSSWHYEDCRRRCRPTVAPLRDRVGAREAACTQYGVHAAPHERSRSSRPIGQGMVWELRIDSERRWLWLRFVTRRTTDRTSVAHTARFKRQAGAWAGR